MADSNNRSVRRSAAPAVGAPSYANMFMTGPVGRRPAPKQAPKAPKQKAGESPLNVGQIMGAVLEAGRAAQAREQAENFSPYERQMAAINQMLSQPYTRRDLQQVTQMLPAQPKAPTMDDTVMGDAFQTSQILYQSQIASIQEQLAAGEIDEKQGQLMVAKATNEQYTRAATLAGAKMPDFMSIAAMQEAAGE